MRKLGLILLLSVSISALGQLSNKVFSTEIQSTYIGQSSPHEVIQAQPAIDIANQSNYSILFDDLSLVNRNGLYMRIIHCQADWSPSNLSDIEYLQDFKKQNIP
jgi:hypothetical protein